MWGGGSHLSSFLCWHSQLPAPRHLHCILWCKLSPCLAADLLIKLGNPSVFQGELPFLGASPFWACIWSSTFVRRLLAPGLLPLCSPPLLPPLSPYCHRCWGRQATFKCGFHKKAIVSVRCDYHRMPQWFKSHRRNSALPGHLGSAVLKIYIFLGFESILCKDHSYYSQWNPVHCLKRQGVQRVGGGKGPHLRMSQVFAFL